MTGIRQVSQADDLLGEGARWLPERRAVAWMDLLNRRLHYYFPDRDSIEEIEVHAPEPLGALAMSGDEESLILTCRRGLHRLDPKTGETSLLQVIDAGRPGMCVNDLAVDALGRVWTGTYEESEVESIGALWCLAGPGQTPVLVDCGFIVPNGPAFSPDGRTMYFSSSAERRIMAYSIASDAPIISDRRVFARFEESDGLPDGMCCDTDGYLWVAHWEGGCVSRWSPEGVRDRTIELPAPLVTSVAFGGDDLSALYVTTAQVTMEDRLAEFPAAGALFAVETGCTGLPMPASAY